MNHKTQTNPKPPPHLTAPPLRLKRRILPNIKAATLDKISPLRAQTAKMIFATLKNKPNMVISPATDGPARLKILTAEIVKPIREKPQSWFARLKKGMATIFHKHSKPSLYYGWIWRIKEDHHYVPTTL